MKNKKDEITEEEIEARRNELRQISISLLGGSTSGKTTFFAGIDMSLLDKTLMFDDKSFAVEILNIKSGKEDSSGKIQDVEEKEITENIKSKTLSSSAAPFSSGISAPAFGGASAPAFGGASAPAFGGASVPAFGGASAPAFSGMPAPDNSNAASDNMDTSKSGSDNGVFLSTIISGEREKAWGIKDGFKGSTSTTRYVKTTYVIKIGDVEKCKLVITDYAGELLDKANNTMGMLQQLAEHISESDASILLANSREMSKHVRDVITHDTCMFIESETKNALSAQRMNDIIKSLNVKNYTVLLAITQSDSPCVDERVSKDNFARASHDLKKYIYQPAFIKAHDRKWSSGVVPVSAIGRNRIDNSPNVDEFNSRIVDKPDLNPENIDTAVLFCLYNAILANIQDIDSELESFKLTFFNKEKNKRKKLLTKQREDLIEIKNLIASDRNLFDKIYDKNCALEVISEVGKVSEK